MKGIVLSILPISAIVAVVVFIFLVLLFLLRKTHKERQRYQLESKELVGKKELEMKNAQLQFLVKMVHEIRTPLSLVVGPIESIKNEREKMRCKGLDTHELDDALDVMERNGNRLTQLVNHLQDFDKIMKDGRELDELMKDENLPSSVVAEDKVVAENEIVDKHEEEPEELMQPALLVVEDDRELCEYVVSHFSECYQVFTATNGLEGLNVLEQHQISLIISDWMMPEMDGVEFCKQVRLNPETSHIPFVMLTAKTDNDSKVESMDCGVDIFIEKPFSMKYLKSCIRNLMERRKMLQDKYSHFPLEPISEVSGHRMDNEFLQKMNKIIDENINNPYLSVVFLAEQMGMSRSSLFVKTKALVDLTPNEMIQLVKLKKAASLLREGKYRVNEVSYMVGFSSPGYFAKCFQKQFGMKPVEFMERG